jgi:hypothetical protein
MTTLSLIVALTGLSPMVAAAGDPSGGNARQPNRQATSRLWDKLSPTQMDNVRGGGKDPADVSKPELKPSSVQFSKEVVLAPNNSVALSGVYTERIAKPDLNRSIHFSTSVCGD